MIQGQVMVAGSIHAQATYHGAISTLRTECTRICSPASGEGIGENYQADAIDPTKVKDQRPKKTNGEIVHHHVYAKPQGEHLKISHCGPIMLLFRKHSRNAARL